MENLHCAIQYTSIVKHLIKTSIIMYNWLFVHLHSFISIHFVLFDQKEKKNVVLIIQKLNLFFVYVPLVTNGNEKKKCFLKV